jgi:hypothetical protein
MNRKILLPLLVLAFATMACSLGNLNPFKETLITPTAMPTNTPVANTSTQSSIYDDFTVLDPDWKEDYVVTTQALPGAIKSKSSINAGKMVFEFNDTETYLYRFYLNPAKADVVIEASVQGAGQQMNGMALTCRVADDLTSWYEFRVNGLSQYFIYRFDQSLKDGGKNPYVLLEQGSLRKDYFKPTSENILRATCQGVELSLESNGNLVTKVSDGTLTESGMVGMGAMSSSLLPVSIRFDYFSYAQP